METKTSFKNDIQETEGVKQGTVLPRILGLDEQVSQNEQPNQCDFVRDFAGVPNRTGATPSRVLRIQGVRVKQARFQVQEKQGYVKYLPVFLDL